MNGRILLLNLSILMLLAGCGGEEAAAPPAAEEAAAPPAAEEAAAPPAATTGVAAARAAAAERAAAAVAAVPELDAEDPTLLRRPFTAAETRGGWQPGLAIIWQMTLPGEDGTLTSIDQRWTVLDADEEGCELEIAVLDAAGNVLAEPLVKRLTWGELHDHGKFKAELATRQDVTYETDFGTFDCWHYTAQDPESGNVNEFVFAKSLPGAPLYTRTTNGDQVLVEMVQKARTPAPTEG